MEAEDPLTYTFDDKKVINAEEQGIYKKFFKLYDKNGDGTMDQTEFKQIMVDMGARQITDDKVKEMLDAQDQNKDGVINWVEFKAMMVQFKGSEGAKFGELKENAMGKVMMQETEGGGKHFYTLEEIQTYASLINLFLKGDEELADCIPMKTDNEDIFHVLDDGAVMCKLLRVLDPDCILEKAIITNKDMGMF
jgi:hypothetical protein